MKLMRLFTQTEQLPKRFKNPVDESLMRRIDEQRERLRVQGIEVTPLLRVRKKTAVKQAASEAEMSNLWASG
jgi:hypothetical protein